MSLLPRLLNDLLRLAGLHPDDRVADANRQLRHFVSLRAVFPGSASDFDEFVPTAQYHRRTA